jgi:hypothetical protein
LLSAQDLWFKKTDAADVLAVVVVLLVSTYIGIELERNNATPYPI